MIEPVATMTCGLFITGEKDVLLEWNESEKAQEIMDEEQNNMSVGKINGLYTEKQMQEYAEAVQEQLNTAKKALTEIAEIIDYDIHECDYGCDNSCELNGSLDMYSVENVQSAIESALAEIGEKDEIN